MSQAIFNKIVEILKANQANFKIIEHEPCGKSADVAKVRGTKLSQGAKALVCHVKNEQEKFYALCVLNADKSADLDALARQLNAKKVSLASPKEVSELSDCVFGAIPPFSFNERLRLFVDAGVLERNEQIAFNAGLLERSIIMSANDYKRIARPCVIHFASEPAPTITDAKFLNGELVGLKKLLRDKKIVLVCLPKLGEHKKLLDDETASICGLSGCSDECAQYNKFHNEFKALGYEIIALSTLDFENAKNFGLAFNNLAMISDEKLELAKPLSLETMKTKDNKHFYHRQTLIIKNAKIIKRFDRISEPSKNASEVLEYLKS